MRKQNELIQLLNELGFESVKGDPCHVVKGGHYYHIRQIEEILTKNGTIPNLGGWF